MLLHHGAEAEADGRAEQRGFWEVNSGLFLLRIPWACEGRGAGGDAGFAFQMAEAPPPSGRTVWNVERSGTLWGKVVVSFWIWYCLGGLEGLGESDRTRLGFQPEALLAEG